MTSNLYRMLDKGTATAAVKTKNTKVQTRNNEHHRSVASQSAMTNVRSDGTIYPTAKKEFLERSDQTDSLPSLNVITQTEKLSTSSIALQVDGPNIRSFGIQIDPPPSPPPVVIHNKSMQTDSPSTRTRNIQHSKVHDHHPCSRRYRCKSPIAYYRACNDCKCHSRPSSPSRQSDEEYY